MAIPRYFGRQGLARYLEISTTRVSQIDPVPDIYIDGAPAWSPESAARLKLAREKRRAQRHAPKAKSTEATA